MRKKYLPILGLALILAACGESKEGKTQKDQKADISSSNKEVVSSNESLSISKNKAKEEKVSDSATLVKDKSSEESEKDQELDLADGYYTTSLFPPDEDGDEGPSANDLTIDGDILKVTGSFDYKKEAGDYDNVKSLERKEWTFKLSSDVTYKAQGGMAKPKYMDADEFKEFFDQVNGNGLGLIIGVKDGQVFDVTISS